MKTKKLNLSDFASNELSGNQKKVILGKGDAPMMTASFIDDPVVVSSTTTTTTPTVPPIVGGNNGDGKIIG